MSIYIYSFLTLAFISIFPVQITIEFKRLMIFFLSLFLIIFVGLRDQVGGDWYSYLEYYDRFEKLSLYEIIYLNDIAYDFLNWVTNRFNGNIYIVNYICAIFFLIPLIIFCTKRDYFLISILISFPYLITIVSMGYVRQAAAIGFFLLGLNFLESKSKFSLILYLFSLTIAFLFHKSAIILFLFFIFFKIKISTKIFLIFSSFIFILILSQYGFFGNVYIRYIETQMQSQGGIIRTLMNLPPALGLLFFKKYFKEDKLYEIFLAISIISVLSLILVPFFSTLIDRISLYFIILQIYFWPKFIYLNKKELRIGIYLLVIVVYFIIYSVWLNLANHREYWLPYKSILSYENHNSIEFLMERY